MGWDKGTHIRIGLKIRHFSWFLIILFGGLLLTQSYWRPYIDNWRCARLSMELGKQYGIVVRYGAPSDFFVHPEKPIENDPKEGVFIGRADPPSAYSALIGVKDAISKYPISMIKESLSAVFIAGKIKMHGIQIGASYSGSWIYLSALKEFEKLGVELYAKSFHHELSSLLLNKGDFPRDRWQAVNDSDFKYLTNRIDVVRAAASDSRKDPKDEQSWLNAGFVHDYGMASLENDFNMYAEMAMTNPHQLKELTQKYSKIKIKTQILVDFYTSIAPKINTYFKSEGLVYESMVE